MKERPILFSAPMVRALLAGTKTQTRRIMKPQPVSNHRGQFNFSTFTDDEGIETYWQNYPLWGPVRSPYGQPGDRLWVRESWRIGAWNENDGSVALDYMADNASPRGWITIPEHADPDGEIFRNLWIQSSNDAENAGVKCDEAGQYRWQPGESPCRRRPSIHMPRWASRILLEITAVRVERLQDISGSDAAAEGVRVPCDEQGRPLLRLTGRIAPSKFCTKRPPDWDANDYLRFEYAELWETINGTGSWDANPFVWVIEFKQIDPKGIDHEKP